MVIGDCRLHAPVMETGSRTNGALMVGRTKHPSRPATEWCGDHQANWELLQPRMEPGAGLPMANGQLPMETTTK